MKETLGSWLQGEMKRRGLTSKELEGRVHDQLGGALSTITTKLSKLLNDHDDGRDHFFADRHPERLEALAAALSVSPDELRARHAGDERRRTLVLDPRLPGEIKDFLQTQEHLPEVSYQCVVVDKTAGDIAAAIKNEMDRVVSPVAVLAGEDVAPFFKFAGLEHTLVREVPRGYELTAYPDLVPIPTARPPAVRDDHGQPLVPLPDQTVSYHDCEGRSLDSDTARRIRDAGKRGEIASVPLPQAISWWSRSGGRFSKAYEPRVRFCDKPAIKLDDVLGTSKETTVWIEEGKIFAMGPLRALLAECVAPHHEVYVHGDIKPLRDLLHASNPWQLADRAAHQGHPLRHLADEVQKWVSDAQNGWVGSVLAGENEEGDARFATDEEAHDVRSRFVELSTRTVKAGRYEIPMVLRRLARAEDIVLVHAKGPCSEYVFDVGAGNLARVRVRKADGTPTPLTPRTKRNNQSYIVLDGGDVVIGICDAYTKLLEGSAYTARRNRILEEERRRHDDDD